MRRAERMARLGTENAFETLAVVNRLIAEGRSIISFAIGEPDFDTPANIKEAGMRALESNHTHYGPSAGLPELRGAIAQYMSRTRGFDVTPSQVVVTPGAKTHNLPRAARHRERGRGSDLPESRIPHL